MEVKDSEASPRYVRIAGPLTRPFPNFDFFFVKALREKAVGLLNLKPGDRVLDVGCGSGASFPQLVAAVGTEGEVVGVEISPEFAVNARNRVKANGWKNVEVIEAPAQTAKLSGQFDGVLMMAAPDVFASEEALENIFAHLKSDARIVIFGAKTTSRRFSRILNPVIRQIFPKLSLPTTPVPNDEPWKLLAERTTEITVEERFFGLMFLLSCVVAPSRN